MNTIISIYSIYKYINMENNLRKIKRSEFQKNNGEEGKDLWVLVNGKVINMQGFKHPGGSIVLTDDHDEDKGDEFDSIHSPAAVQEMKNRIIGVLVEDDVEEPRKLQHKKTDGDIVEANSTTNARFLFIIIPIFIVFGLVFWQFSKIINFSNYTNYFD
jgi:cytochrome b involved in lipid metabolism